MAVDLGAHTSAIGRKGDQVNIPELPRMCR